MICPYPDCGKEGNLGIVDGAGQCPHCRRIVYADEILPEPKQLEFIGSKSMLLTPKEKGFVVEHLIQPNTVNQIYSPPACFKSTIALQLAICVANGKPFLGFKTKKVNVAYLDKENNRQILRNRLNGLFKGMNLKRKSFPLFFLLREGMLDDNLFLEKLSNYVHKNKIGLVVFDTLVRFNSGEENSAKDMNKLYQAFVKLQNGNKTAILFLHHTNRAGEFRGSSDLLGQVDTQFLIERSQKNTSFKMVNTKNRLGEVEDIFGEILFGEDSITITKNEAIALDDMKARVNKFSLARAFVCDFAKKVCPSAVHSFERAKLMAALEGYNVDKGGDYKISRRTVDSAINYLLLNKILVKAEKKGVFSLNCEQIELIDKWISPIGEGGATKADALQQTQN